MVKETADLTTQETDAATGSDPFADPPEILTLRHEVRALCMRFPDPYWRDLDRRREYPEAFVQALTEAGWLAALIPARYGGLGYWSAGGRRHLAGDQPERRLCRSRARADVRHGHTPPTRFRGAEGALPAVDLRTERCACKRSRSRSRGPERIRPGSRPPPPAMATTTSSRVARCSSPGCSTPI